MAREEYGKFRTSRGGGPIQPVQFVCARCPQSPKPLVKTTSEMEEAQCPRCGKYYRVWTARLSGPAQEAKLSPVKSRYQLPYKDSKGRIHTQSFTAQAGLTYPDNHTVTLVWSRGKLVGIADQTEVTWDRVILAKTRGGSLWKLMSFVVGIYILILGIHYLQEIWPLLQAGPNWIWAVIALVVLVLCSPLAAWILRPERE